MTVLSEKTRTSADERLKGDLDYKFPANKMFFSAFTLSNFRMCRVARAGTNIMIFSSIPEAEVVRIFFGSRLDNKLPAISIILR